MCDEADEGDVLLLCDGCDNAFHLQCTKPRLRKIPAGMPQFLSSYTNSWSWHAIVIYCQPSVHQALPALLICHKC